jgi:N-acetylmuramoyl-L-alanine amidase
VKLCIDAGHGASNRRTGVYDPGAVSPSGTTEADVVLLWALTGKHILASEFGIDVFLTRADDRDPNPVGGRDDEAEAADCTHFISLHCNAASGTASGTETFYRDGADKSFALKVQAAAVAVLGLKDRGIKSESVSQHGSLAVFGFDGPAALLEIGFIDHPVDRQKMLSRDNRIAFWRTLGEVLTQ